MAVLVHACDQQLAGTEVDGLARPLNGITPRRLAAAVRVDLPLTLVAPTSIDRHDDALAPEPIGPLRNQRRILHRGCIDRNLVRAQLEQAPHVLVSADP